MLDSDDDDVLVPSGAALSGGAASASSSSSSSAAAASAASAVDETRLPLGDPVHVWHQESIAAKYPKVRKCALHRMSVLYSTACVERTFSTVYHAVHGAGPQVAQVSVSWTTSWKVRSRTCWHSGSTVVPAPLLAPAAALALAKARRAAA